MYLKGLYLYFNGKQTSLNIGYNSKFDRLNTQTQKQCELELGRPLYLYLRGNDNEMTVSYHYDKEDKYKLCQKFDIQPKDMELFYVNFFARSYGSTPFLVNVRSMVYSSDTENIGISEFEAKVDDNATKLFRQISFYTLNEEFLKSKQVKVSDEELNVKRLFDSQTEVLNVLDYTNILLDKNLEEGEEMLEFLSKQRSSTENYAKSLLDSLNNWMGDTTKQFELMEKDALNLLTEYQNFDLDAEFEKTKTLMTELSQKVGTSWQSLQNFRRYADQIKPNIDYLVKKKKHLQNFPELVEKYVQGHFNVTNENYGTTILIMFVGLGLVVIVALLAILKRLSRSQKAPAFEM